MRFNTFIKGMGEIPNPKFRVLGLKVLGFRVLGFRVLGFRVSQKGNAGGSR